MARISGIDLPRDKRIEIALTYIFGIGLPTSQKLLAQTGVNPNVRVKDLAAEDENKLCFERRRERAESATREESSMFAGVSAS